MFGYYGASINDDPSLGAEWAPKGSESKTDAEFVILKEKKKDDITGTVYRLEDGKTGKDRGWVELSLLKKYYAPWNDPYRSQKKWAKKFGFTWKDSLDG